MVTFSWHLLTVHNVPVNWINTLNAAIQYITLGIGRNWVIQILRLLVNCSPPPLFSEFWAKEAYYFSSVLWFLNFISVAVLFIQYQQQKCYLLYADSLLPCREQLLTLHHCITTEIVCWDVWIAWNYSLIGNIYLHLQVESCLTISTDCSFSSLLSSWQLYLSQPPLGVMYYGCLRHALCSWAWQWAFSTQVMESKLRNEWLKYECYFYVMSQKIASPTY